MDNIKYSTEKMAIANNISICYDSFGELNAKPLILIHGLGMQLIAWDDDFCKGLAKKGYLVFRIDNRDVGLSTKIESKSINIIDIVENMGSRNIKIPYKLEDMADDVIGFMDYLKIESAIIVGLSMGAMIAQLIAINYPKRVDCLVSMMSSTGNPDLPQPTQEAISILLTPYPPTEEAYIESNVKVRQALSGYGKKLDEEYVRKRSKGFFLRGYFPEGVGRQLAAVLTAENRDEKLKKLNVPALIIHGDDDPMIRLESGIHTSKMIHGSKLHIVKGLGHDLPVYVFDEIINVINDFIKETCGNKA